MSVNHFAQTSQLSLKARRLLARFGVSSADQLLDSSLVHGSRDILLDMRVGREIVAWARREGISVGPSPEWWVLLDAAEADELSLFCRRALWRVSLIAASPKETDPEDVTMEITFSRAAQEEFRAWASKNAGCFGASLLVGLSPKNRRHLRQAGFSHAEELSLLRVDEFQALTNKSSDLLKEVEQWLKAQGLKFAGPALPTAGLSNFARRALRRLKVREQTDLLRLRLRDFASVKHCQAKTVQQIERWAKGLGYEIPP